MNVLKKYWHWILIGGIFFFEAAVLLLCRENIYVGICDNLDLFITQLKMLRDNGAFFAHGQDMPVLGGIDRDYFPSEFSLYNFLYLILPDIYAYIAGYLLKLALAFASCILIAGQLLREKFRKYQKPVALTAAAFALLPVYPMYALCFASMPLIFYLLIRIYQKPKWQLYLAVFFYPLVSYFSFFGAFILGYILIAAVILWIKDRRFPFSLAAAFVVLAAGFVCFEYRLFGIMFFSGTETIRSTMVTADYGAADLWKCFLDVFLHGFSHARSAHTYFVLPVCGLYLIWNNVRYFVGKKQGKPYMDVFNLTVLFILFNCLVYSLYYWEPLRTLVETIAPPTERLSIRQDNIFQHLCVVFCVFYRGKGAV